MGAESSPAVPPRAWVEVDLGAVVRNAEALARHARAPLIPMVKADAYGLGAVPVVRALERLAPLAYGVSSIPEGRSSVPPGSRGRSSVSPRWVSPTCRGSSTPG